MDAFLDQTLNAKQTVLPNDPFVFCKEFEKELLETWCRVRVANDGVTVCSTDGRVVQGSVERVHDRRGSSKKLCTWMETAWVSESALVKGNEFFHEAAVSRLVQQHLADIPVFSRGLLKTAGWQGSSHKAVLTFQRVQGEELERIVNDMTLEEMRSVMLQVLAAICIAQQRIQLKHHDLHLFNVLITPKEEMEPSVWTVNLPCGRVDVPLVGLHATIIDFGLSAATDPSTQKRHVRLDEELLMKKPRSEDSEMTDDDDWGVWGPELASDTGYDFVMFVESFVEELVRDRPLNLEKLGLVASLQKLIDVEITSRGRPVEKTMVDWKAVFETLGAIPQELKC